MGKMLEELLMQEMNKSYCLPAELNKVR